MRFVYTKYGILTEDRARELLEACGDGMDECGYAGDMDDTRMGGFPDSKSPIKVVIVGDDSQLEEADTSSAADGGSVTGTQVALSKPQGPSGAPAPSGASVTKESLRRYAKIILEAKKLKRLLEQKVEEGQLTPELEEEISNFLLNTAHLRNFFANFLSTDDTDDSSSAPIQLNHDILPELSQVNRALLNIRRFLTTGQRAMLGANFKRPQPRVTSESFNRHAEYLLETWLEEELHGDQDELDIAPPYGKLTRADFKNLQRRKSTHKKD